MTINSARLQRLGLFVISASPLPALWELLKLPGWLGGAAIIIYGLLWQVLWPSRADSFGQRKSVLRLLVETIVFLVIGSIGIGLTVWLETSLGLRLNYALALVFWFFGLVLLIVSLLLPRGPALPNAEAASDGKKSSLLQTLIDRIKQI